MKTQTKIVILELVGGIFGWIWILSLFATIVFFVMAIGFGWRWLYFAIAIIVGMLSKWLARGFRDNQIRVAYEAKLVEQGMTPEEAGQKWEEDYFKQ